MFSPPTQRVKAQPVDADMEHVSDSDVVGGEERSHEGGEVVHSSSDEHSEEGEGEEIANEIHSQPLQCGNHSLQSI